jgi:hypothetical protein
MFINEGIPIVIATIPERAGLTALSWPRNEAKGISWPCVNSPSIYVNFRLTSSIVLDKGTEPMSCEIIAKCSKDCSHNQR